MLIVLPQAAFWLGYYWLYIPFDVLFMSLTLGLINGLNLSGGFKRSGAWVAVSTLSALPGFATGALGAYPLNDWLVAQSYPPLLKDFAVWLSISSNLGILYLTFQVVWGVEGRSGNLAFDPRHWRRVRGDCAQSL